MKLVKSKLLNHTYLFPTYFRDDASLYDLARWMSTIGKNKFTIPESGTITITDEKIEVLFILKWVQN